MEGVGARFGRSSTRYGPAAVFSGPVRKWKKTWVETTSSPSSNPSSLSSNRTRDASHLLLYKWTPISQSSNDAAAVEEQPQRKFRFVPVSLIEEKEEAAANADEETKPNGTNPSPMEDMVDDTADGKPDVYDLAMEETQASDNNQPAVQEVSESNLDLNLGWKTHNRVNSSDHRMLDQSTGWNRVI